MFTVQGLLDRLAPCRDASTWWLGLSGGLDSMVLLAALAELRSEQTLPPLQAIHVHHGLNPAADGWAEHCERECARRQVPLRVARVAVGAGASVENVARQARYAAFEQLLAPGDQLLLAHHLDDQLETLLFRLVRGTGLLGLAGMPVSRRLGAGQLQRPLLGWTRQQLERWARSQNLLWIEDPANQDFRFARTGLREEVLPALRRLWPGTDASLQRLARHASEAVELLDDLALDDLRRHPALTDPWLAPWPSLDADRLAQLSAARQRNLLRFWLRQQGQPMPDARRLDDLLRQLRAANDGQPALRIGSAQLVRSAGRLWLLPTEGVPSGQAQGLAMPAGDVTLAAGNGRLRSVRAAAGLALERGVWEIRYGSPAQRIRLAGRPRQSLKQLFQDAGVPAWLRPAVPLLYRNGELVSVAGRWNDPDACAGPEEPGWSLTWEPRTGQS